MTDRDEILVDVTISPRRRTFVNFQKICKTKKREISRLEIVKNDSRTHRTNHWQKWLQNGFLGTFLCRPYTTPHRALPAPPAGAGAGAGAGACACLGAGAANPAAPAALAAPAPAPAANHLPFGPRGPVQCQGGKIASSHSVSPFKTLKGLTGEQT